MVENSTMRSISTLVGVWKLIVTLMMPMALEHGVEREVDQQRGDGAADHDDHGADVDGSQAARTDTDQ